MKNHCKHSLCTMSCLNTNNRSWMKYYLAIDRVATFCVFFLCKLLPHSPYISQAHCIALSDSYHAKIPRFIVIHLNEYLNAMNNNTISQCSPIRYTLLNTLIHYTLIFGYVNTWYDDSAKPTNFRDFGNRDFDLFHLKANLSN